MRRYLAGKPEQFALTLTEKLMVFALGRSVEFSDKPRIRAIVRQAARQDYRFSALLTGIVQSDQFRKARSAPDKPAATTTAALQAASPSNP